MTYQAVLRDSSPPLRLSLLLGSVYFFTLAWQPYPGSAALKGLSIATLAWVAFASGSRLLTFGLAASALGDVLLDIRSINLFVPGLSSFLIAHLAYTVLFYELWRRPVRLSEKRRIAAGLVVLYAILFTTWLAPSLGSLAIPVVLYVCAITAMVTAAIAGDLPSRVIAGAVLFFISDSVLAIAKFKATFAGRDYLVWGTYYFAQYLIATGILRFPRSR